MSHSFSYSPDSSDTEIRLVGPQGPIAPDDWALQAPVSLQPGVDLIQQLIGDDVAIASDDAVLVENTAVAALSSRDGKAIGLPQFAPAVAHIRMSGVITRADFRAVLEWRRNTGQPILGATRRGAFLRIGDEWWRLPESLFSIAESIDRLNRSGGDEMERFASLADLRGILPTAEVQGSAQSSGLASTMSIAVADGFSLDLIGEGEDTQLVPILRGAADSDDEPLLSEQHQQIFGLDQFNRFGEARSVYALGGGTYVVLTPALKKCLQVVRRTQSATAVRKRALMESPRATIALALGASIDEDVLEKTFRETERYSERVVGLGLWRRRVLPWLPLQSTDWFEQEPGGSSSSPNQNHDREEGILVGDQPIPLNPTAADDLRQRVEVAIGDGVPSVTIRIDGEDIHVPATIETLAALQQLESQRSVAAPPPGDNTSPAGKTAAAPPEVLIIRPNEEAVELEGLFKRRDVPTRRRSGCLRTTLKAHQEEGLDWLQKSYGVGRPGVLLADDMGLGKTLQALAFLAWLREGMEAGQVERAPVAVIAPTGLLENWKAEEQRHLDRPGIGTCLEAFGRGLATLKRAGPDGQPILNTEAIASADWVLTTYETLRDYDRDFGAVRFAAILFDEAQKIKTPGIRLTDAAKAMNADFRVALTGTPVENRLADLWCITDAVHPALLGDLKSFSRQYEASPDPVALKRLKHSLDTEYPGRPPLLLRRLKTDRLPDLPRPEERRLTTRMPMAQSTAYEAAIAKARERRGTPGATLEGLQDLRRISLHPDIEMTGSDQEFIDASARLSAAIITLDSIHAAGERALIFLEDRALQARLSGILQRRYRLSEPPMIINGAVPGPTRQARVDRFQANADGFSVMILSSRAGGVGLTLTAANHAIHLSRWWNPAVEDQCTGRVLRIGQTRPVFVYLPISTLGPDRPSFDENLDDLLDRKRKLFQEAFMPPEATENERNELFRATIG